jgi:hypothetical protein
VYHIKPKPHLFLSTTMLASLVLLANCTDEVLEPVASEVAAEDEEFRGGGIPCDGICPNVALSGSVPINMTGTNVGAGDDMDPACGSVGGEDVSFAYIVPADGLYQFDTNGSDFDTTLTVQEGLCVEGTGFLCDDDAGDGVNSLVVLDLFKDQEITIILDGFSAGSFGNYNLNITEPTSPCPVPTDLGEASPSVVSGSVQDTPSELMGSCAGDGPEATFLWTAPFDDTYTFNTFGSNYDTVLYLLDTDCSGSELACNDDHDDSLDGQAQVTVDLVGGQSIYIVLDAYFAGGGDYVLNIEQTIDPDDGDCCVSHSGPECEVPDISSCVCGFDAYCCTVEWDDTCVEEAVDFCSAIC